MKLTDIFLDPESLGFHLLEPDMRPGTPLGPFEVSRTRGDLENVFKIDRKPDDKNGDLAYGDLLLDQRSGLVAYVIERIDAESSRLQTVLLGEKDIPVGKVWCCIGIAWEHGCPPPEHVRRNYRAVPVVNLSRDDPESYDKFMGNRKEDYEPSVGRDVMLGFTKEQLEEAHRIGDQLVETMLTGDLEDKVPDLNEPLDSSGDVQVVSLGDKKKPKGTVYDYRRDEKGD